MGSRFIAKIVKDNIKFQLEPGSPFIPTYYVSRYAAFTIILIVFFYKINFDSIL